MKNIWSMKLSAMIFTFAILNTHNAYGQPINNFVAAFIDNCTTRAGDVQRLVNIIENDKRYIPMKKKDLEIFAPESSKSNFVAWVVKEGAGAPYVLSLSSFNSASEVRVICSMMSDKFDSNKLAELIRPIIPLGALTGNTVRNGKRIRIWSAPKLTESALIIMDDSSPLGISGVTLSVAAEPQ